MEENLKQLLLKDLCARLPYGVKLYHEDDYGDNIGKLESININDDECVIWNYNETDTDIFDIEDVKPYLRPMSSMTKKEQKEFNDFCVIDELAWKGGNMQGYINQAEIMQTGIDWLNAHHFDYRGLIEKGLALEAPDGMYDSK